MAFHYSANQYERSYRPKILRNWEVPKYYPCNQPRTRKGFTKIISNNEGHLLPGQTKSKKNPWHNYIGTWDLPCHITRKKAEELNGEKLVREQRLRCKCIKNKPIVGEHLQEKSKVIEEVKEEYPLPTIEQVKEDIKHLNGEKLGDFPYVPGDLIEEKHRLPSYKQLEDNRFKENEEIKTSGQGLPKHKDDFSKKSPEPEEGISRDDVEKIYQQNQTLKETMFDPQIKPKSGKKKLASPILAAISNFSFAKKLHKENLEHDPLPDTVMDAKYRKMQMQKNGKPPGLGLDEGNYATGVGWKGYPGYGPTRCTKLKVFRPKTCVQVADKIERPTSSICSFDKKWRFLRQKKVTPIELAICWDLTPENPKDEPKPPTHIDGSNGSAAPAVFSLVSTPKDENAETNDKCDGLRMGATIFEHLPAKLKTDRDFVLDRPKTVAPTRRPSTESSQSGSKNSFFERRRALPQSQESSHSNSDKLKYNQVEMKRAKSAYNLNNNNNNNDDVGGYNNQLCKNCIDYYNSDPHLVESCYHQKCGNKRLCMACEMKKVSIKDRDKQPPNEFKLAFKAGVPQKSVSRALRRTRVEIKVPKQKNPFSPRRYVICSLAPPFSLQRDKRHEYPEHWRLATVYQHSYKPIQYRKRPLLATVFK